MKKILFASTALVASAGFAAAEVSFSGEAGFGVVYNGTDWNPDYYTTLSVAMTGETDGGLSFGADFDITIDNPHNGAASQVISDTEVHIEGGFGKLTVGDVGSASDAKLGLGDIGYSGLGTDNVAEVMIDLADSGNIMYTGSFGDFGVALSYDMNGTEIFSVVATYAMGDYNFGIGYDDWGTAPGSAFHVKAGGTFGDIALNALYSRSSSANVNTFGVTADYTMGAATITAAYSRIDTGLGDADVYGLGVSYDLGGGASVVGGVADTGTTTVADLGIKMSF